jgi:hypothetical protein
MIFTSTEEIERGADRGVTCNVVSGVGNRK